MPCPCSEVFGLELIIAFPPTPTYHVPTLTQSPDVSPNHKAALGIHLSVWLFPLEASPRGAMRPCFGVDFPWPHPENSPCSAPGVTRNGSLRPWAGLCLMITARLALFAGHCCLSRAPLEQDLSSPWNWNLGDRKAISPMLPLTCWQRVHRFLPWGRQSPEASSRTGLPTVGVSSEHPLPVLPCCHLWLQICHILQGPLSSTRPCHPQGPGVSKPGKQAVPGLWEEKEKCNCRGERTLFGFSGSRARGFHQPAAFLEPETHHEDKGHS